MLTIEDNLLDDFPLLEPSDWLQAVRKSLRRDASLDKLSARTEDDLLIRALYTLADAPDLGASAEARAAAPREWEIRQECKGASTAELRAVAAREIAGGATGLLLRPGGLDLTLSDISTLLAGIDLAKVTIALDSGTSALPAAALLLKACQDLPIEPAAVRLLIGLDPLATLASCGELPCPVDQAMDQLAALTRLTCTSWPSARAVRVSNRPYHLAGSTACQDIAFTLATGLSYLRHLEAAGLPLADAAGQIEFSFQIDCRFFESAAMLRAARLLWKRLLAASGLQGAEIEAATMYLHVQTGERVLTRRDPWVNLLRNTACCLASALAGADAVTTIPHDAAVVESSNFARRISRNTQLVLQKESGLHRVADPLGGSYFIETLTLDMARRAWTILQQIEAAGGMAEALRIRLAHELIEPARLARTERIARKEQLITGVTAYANPHEQVPPDPPAAPSAAVAPVAPAPSAAVQTVLDELAQNEGRSAHDLPELLMAAAGAGASIEVMQSALAQGGEPVRIAPLPAVRIAEPFEQIGEDASVKGGAS